MSEYDVEIEGKYDLKQIELQLQSEEAGASELLECKISLYDGRITNICKFRTLEPGTVPGKLSLLKQSDEQPAGTEHVWTGVMIVSDSNEAVSAYRAEEEENGG